MPRRGALRLRRPTAREEGYRWPAEWERHEATWMAWPHDPETWTAGLEEVEGVFSSAISWLAAGEAVHVLVPDAEVGARARARLPSTPRVSLHRVRTRDAWIRDYGPLVVVRGRGRERRRLALDFRFNAWGGKYPSLLPDDGVPARLRRIHGLETRRPDVVLEGGSVDGNGRGSVLTTEQCLLNPNRNPRLLRSEVEAHLREWLGARQVLWLGEGIAGDDTDGHVDDVARFVGPRRVVAAVEEDRSDPNFGPLADNLRRLQAMADPTGRPFEVIPLPMPEPVLDAEGRRLPASYANFYVGNRVVLLPLFGQRRDARALGVIRRCFPRRRVRGLPCRRVVEGLGAIHCLTMQHPA